jgi:hypothetical protein
VGGVSRTKIAYRCCEWPSPDAARCRLDHAAGHAIHETEPGRDRLASRASATSKAASLRLAEFVLRARFTATRRLTAAGAHTTTPCVSTAALTTGRAHGTAACDPTAVSTTSRAHDEHLRATPPRFLPRHAHTTSVTVRPHRGIYHVTHTTSTFMRSHRRRVHRSTRIPHDSALCDTNAASPTTPGEAVTCVPGNREKQGRLNPRGW